MSWRGDNRGVSIALNNVLSIAITTVLISGLIIATSGFMQSQRANAATDELSIIGQRTATDLVKMDQYVTQRSVPELVLETRLPSRVVGSSYLLSLSNETAVCGSGPCLVLTTVEPEEEVVIALDVSSPIEPSSVTGGTVRLVYDGSTLTIEEGDP